VLGGERIDSAGCGRRAAGSPPAIAPPGKDDHGKHALECRAAARRAKQNCDRHVRAPASRRKRKGSAVDCPAAHTDRHGATVGREAGNIGRRGGTRGRCRRRAAERPPRCPLRTSSSAPSVPTAGMTLRLPGRLLRNCWAALRAARRWRSPRAWGLAPQADRSHARCSGGVSRRPRHAHAPVAAPARNRVGD
jgi:hypothetical protein